MLKAEGMKLDAVLDLEVPEDEVVKRIAGRRICRNDSAHVFHVTYNPPKSEGVCDVCGGELYQRDDDTEETVRTRLEVYHTQTEPIIDYYRAQGLVVTISALGAVDGGHRARDGGAEAGRRGAEPSPYAAAVRSRPRCPQGAAAVLLCAVSSNGPQRSPYPSPKMQRGAEPMVQIKTPEQIAKMREAGLVVAAIHAATREAAVPGATTQGPGRGRPQGDRRPRRQVELPRATAASPRPSAPRSTRSWSTASRTTKTVLKDGDIISIDAGAIVDGWHGDAAYTAFVGTGHAPELVELSRVTEESMWAGIAAMKHGQPARRRLPGDRDVHPPPAAARRPASTGSSRTTAATASAPRCTWTRTC